MIPNARFKIIEVPITVGTSAYDASDVVGGTLTSDAIDQYQGGGRLEWVRIVDDDSQSEPYLLYVYNAAPSTIADAAAFAPTEADWLKTLGCISIAAADYDASGDEACAFSDAVDAKTGLRICFDNLPTGKLYFRLVANASTPDYTAADDVTIHLGMWVS
jgi:hypothetical protein